jgi:hypothetical protein
MRVVIGSFLAAVVFFFWGFLYWTVLPLAKVMMPKHPKEELVVAALDEHTPTTGVYFFPGLVEGDDTGEKWAEAHTRGPFGTIIFVKEGMDPSDGGTLSKGFLHGWTTCLLAAALLALSARNLPTYASRAGYVALLGVFAAVLVFASQAIWFGHPLPYTMFSAAYYILGMVWTGLVLAAIVQSPVKGEPPS